MYQDFSFNIDPNENIKRTWRRTDYTYEDYILEINKYIDTHLYKNKILLNIYIVNNGFYISDLYLQTIINKYSSKIPIYSWLSKYLFKDTQIKSDYIKNFTKEYLKLESKYIQFNNEIIKIINLNNFIDTDELKILYNLYITNDFNDDLIKLCGTKNKQEQEYYRFIFKNIEFKFVNYQSDINKLKQEYDSKILELEQKIKTLEMLILEKN
jgi:hypothetical protein